MRKYAKRKLLSAGAAAFCLFMAGYSLWMENRLDAYASENIKFNECWLKTVGSKDSVGNISSWLTVEDVFIKQNDIDAALVLMSGNCINPPNFKALCYEDDETQ